MTLSTTTPSISYTSTGPATYAFPFEAYDKNHIKVENTDDVTIVTTALVLDTDYTVTFNGDNTGDVIVTSGTTSGDTLKVFREMPIEQVRNLTNGEKLDLEIIERVFDEVTMILQQQEEFLKKPLELVAEDIDDVNTVAANIAAIILLVTDLSNVDIVATDIANVNIVATNITNVNSVATNINNVNAVANNETDISFVADNLTDIQTIAGTITMTNDALSLTLHPTVEVAGSQYTSVQDAYDYAKTVMQVGATLTLNVPASTTITETAQVDIDLKRLNVNIVGSSITTSILNVDGGGGSAGLIARGPGKLEISDLKIVNLETDDFSEVLMIQYGQGHLLSDVHLVAGSGSFAGGLKLFRTKGINYSGGTIDSIGNAVLSEDSHHSFFVSLTCNLSGSNNVPLMNFQGMSTGELSVVTLDATGHTGTSTGVSANEYSRILAKSMTLTALDTNYNPTADTYGNYYSRIITVL